MELEIFQKHFYSEYNDITDLLNKLDKNESTNEQEQKLVMSNQYEAISNRIEILKKYFTENTLFIPNYEVRKAQEYLSKLNKLSQEKRDLIFPKKRFGFKSKQNMTTLESAIQKANTIENTAKNPLVQETLNSNLENTCSIKDLQGESNFIKYESEINGKDISIVNVKNCCIQLMGNPSVLHMSNVDSCTILCGPMTSTAFINSCINSKICIASHQLRIHETKNTQFYIHVGSRAIIENCSQVTFAPYAWKYPKFDAHFEMSKLKSNEINWTSIDDFNWLNQEQKSPNWNFLDEADRTKWSSDEAGELRID